MLYYVPDITKTVFSHTIMSFLYIYQVSSYCYFFKQYVIIYNMAHGKIVFKTGFYYNFYQNVLENKKTGFTGPGTFKHFILFNINTVILSYN